MPSYCNTQNLDAIPSFLKERSVKPEPRAGHALSASPGDSSVTPGEQRGAGALQELQAEPCLPPAADPSEQGADGFHSVGDLGA